MLAAWARLRLPLTRTGTSPAWESEAPTWVFAGRLAHQSALVRNFHWIHGDNRFLAGSRWNGYPGVSPVLGVLDSRLSKA